MKTENSRFGDQYLPAGGNLKLRKEISKSFKKIKNGSQRAIQNRMEELQCRTPLNFTATIGFMPDRFRESRILTVASDLWKKTPENFSNGSRLKHRLK